MSSCNSIRTAAFADWPCNEASGNLVDSTGNGNTLTVNGVPDAYEADGPGYGYDKSIDFGSAWAVSAGAVVPTSGDFSISGWVRTDAIDGYRAWVRPFNTAAGASYIRSSNLGDGKYRAYLAGINTIPEAVATPVETWKFVTLQRVGNVFSMYTGGVLAGTAGSAADLVENEVVLNSISDSGSQHPHKGRIAAVTISSETDVHDELMAGPEPTYTSGASLSTAGVFSAGIWDNQQNGTLTYTCELRSSDGYVRETVSASSGTFTLTPNVGDALWVKVENDGGADVGDDGAGYYKLATREATSYTEITEEDRSLRLRLLGHGPAVVDDEFTSGSTSDTYGDLPAGWDWRAAGIVEPTDFEAEYTGDSIILRVDNSVGSYANYGILHEDALSVGDPTTIRLRWRRVDTGSGVVPLLITAAGFGSIIANINAAGVNEWQVSEMTSTPTDTTLRLEVNTDAVGESAEVEIDYIRVYQHDGTTVENAGWAVHDEFDNGSTAGTYGDVPNGWAGYSSGLTDAETQYCTANEGGTVSIHLEHTSGWQSIGFYRSAVIGDVTTEVRWRRVDGSGDVNFITMGEWAGELEGEVNSLTAGEWQTTTVDSTSTADLYLALSCDEADAWAEIEIDYVNVYQHATLEGGKDLDTVRTTGPTDHLPDALNYSGVGDYADCGNLGLPDADQTFACWVHTTSNEGYLMSTRNDTVGGLSAYITPSDDLRAVVGVGQQTLPIILWDHGEWTHVGMVYDAGAGTIEYYVNGSLAGTVASVTGAWATSVHTLIGARDSIASKLYFLEGDIAQPAIYARALSADEILHLANGPEPIYASGGSLQSDGLYGIGNWLNLDSPGIAYDVDLRSADGTVKETKTTDAGYFAATVEVGDQLWVKVSSDGGYDTADDGNGYYRVTTVRATTLAELDNHQALAVHLKLQDDAATTVVVNEVGDNATLEGGGTALDNSVNGPCRGVEKALTLDGVADYIDCGDVDAAEFGGTDKFTISAWVKPGAGDEGGYIVSQNRATYGWGLYWNGTPNTINVSSGTNVTDGCGSDAVFTDTDWVHVIAVCDGEGVQFYRNGVAAGYDTWVASPTVDETNSLMVGARDGSTVGAVLLEGDLADVRVYATDLDADEVAKLAVQPPRLSNVLESSYIHVV